MSDKATGTLAIVAARKKLVLAELRTNMEPANQSTSRAEPSSRMSPRITLIGIILLLVVTINTTGFAQPVPAALPSLAPDEVDQAIHRGLDFLLTKQRDDGAITDRHHETTMTSLAIMAMASVGTTPQEGAPRGEAMQRALAFVLRDDRQDKDGYFGNRDGSRMYGHGITTLMLTEMLGMGKDEEQDRLIHARCQKAIDLILSAQKQSKDRSNRGGWRYAPNAPDSDLSVSVWQLMALRSAKNDGLQVPTAAIQDAIEYLQRSYTVRLDSEGLPVEPAGGFSYTPGSTNATYTMTAAGLLAMQVCGQYQSPLVLGATEWLKTKPPRRQERFFFYGTYYYAQGMHQRGGEVAEEAQRQVRDQLLPLQKSDGSWASDQGEESSAGQVYATSLAILSLSVKYHYLPIYQR